MPSRMGWEPGHCEVLLARLKEGHSTLVEVFPEGFFDGMELGMRRRVVQGIVFKDMVDALRDELDSRYREEWDHRGLDFRVASEGVVEVGPAA